MPKTSENTNSSCSASGQRKCAPVCLLLFIGFIFGFSIGFASHDVIFRSLSKVMYGGKYVVFQPIGKTEKVEMPDPTQEEVTTSDVAPTAAPEAPQEEEKKPVQTDSADKPVE